MPLDELEISEEEKAVMQDDGPVEEVSVEEPVEESKEEPKEEVKEELKQEDNKKDEILVNLQKALKETRHEYNEKIDRFKNEFLELKAKVTAPPEVKPPDPAEDPLGAQQYEIQQLRKEIAELRGQGEQTSKKTEYQDFVIQVNNSENEFRRSNPDYDNAYKFLKDFRIGELQELGITDERQVSQVIGKWSFDISSLALKNGINPAEKLYSLAKRYGYKPEAEKKAENTEALTHLEAVAKSQEKAGKNLGTGEETDDKISLEAVMKAEGAEFDKLWDKYFKAEKK